MKVSEKCSFHLKEEILIVHVILLNSSCLTTDTEHLDTVEDTVDVLMEDDTHALALENVSLVATEQGDFTDALRFNIYEKSTNQST